MDFVVLLSLFTAAGALAIVVYLGWKIYSLSRGGEE